MDFWHSKQEWEDSLFQKTTVNHNNINNKKIKLMV